MPKRFLSRLAYLILFLLVVAVSTTWTVHFLVKAGDDVEVPDLTGKTTVEAEQLLGAKRLILDIQGSQHSDKFPEGVILHQLVPAGEWVRSGRHVGVLLSKGLREQVAPRVIGLEQGAAKLVLASSDLDIVITSKACDDSTPADKIIAQDPPAGTLMSSLSLSVLSSAGSCTNRYVMPEALGVFPKEFVTDMDRKGFVVRFFQYEESDAVPPGTITRVLPQPGSILKVTDPITIFINNAQRKVVEQSAKGSRLVYIRARSPLSLFGKPGRLQFQRGNESEDDVIDFFMSPGENEEFIVWMPPKAEAIFSLDGQTMWRKEY